MIPLIPIVGWAIGGLIGAAAVAAACDSDDDSTTETDDFAARMAAAREKSRRERAARERRRKARLEEAEEDLSRVMGRHSRRISSAQKAAAYSKSRLDELAAVDRALDEVLK